MAPRANALFGMLP